MRRLDEAMAEGIADLVERCVVVHITGPDSFARAEALRDSLPEDRRERYRPFAFLHEDMAAALSAADLLVGRAGSSTLAEATAAGLPMIVVPYPHAAAHQRANAAELVAAGAARLVADEDLDGDRLRQAADLLAGPDLADMAAASRSLGRPGAAAATVDLLVALADRAGPARRGERRAAHAGGTMSARLTAVREAGRQRGHRPPAGHPGHPRRAAGAAHHDARGRAGRPLRGGSQPLRAARHRALRPQP